MVHLYNALREITPSPIVELAHAVAVSMADGPGTALELVDELRAHPLMHGYHRLPSVRADLLFRLGRLAEAKSEFLQAASLAENGQERTLLQARAAQCDAGATSSA